MECNNEKFLPKFIDKKFLQKAIKSYKNDDTIQLIDYSVNSAFSQHFASEMFQVKINFLSTKHSKTEVINVVIKAKPIKDVLKMEVVAGGPLFETEISMYRKALPAIQRLFEQNGIEFKCFPDVIYITEEPFPIIVLKDMTADGFTIYMQPPENYDDTKKIFKRLAQFHAASYYLTENNTEDFSNYTYSVYQTESIVKAFFQDTIKIFRDVIQSWKGFEDYLSRVDYLLEHTGEIGRKSYTPNNIGHGFNVLNHGDFHMRNILIRNDVNKRLEDSCFIDYQLSVWCSPVVDLIFAMRMIQRDQDDNLPIDDIIRYYHQVFIETLNCFGFMKQPPSLLDLNVELLKHGSISVLLTICFLPFSFVDWETMKVDDMLGNDSEKSRNFKRNLFEHPACKRVMQKELKNCLQKGWL